MITGPWTETEELRLIEIDSRRPRPMLRIQAELMNRSENSVRNKLFTLRQEGRHDWMADERIGFFDIEASHLKANIGNMVSWAMKPMGGEVVYAGWTRKEAINWDKMDRRIMKELIKELQNYDLICTYYGTGFDLKFIRTRAMILGLEGFPTFGQLKHWDIYYSVRGRMSLHSNRLAVATQTLGIEGKTPLPPEIWGEARLGYPGAMEYIKEHNIEDVLILESLAKEVMPFVKIIRKSI